MTWELSTLVRFSSMGRSSHAKLQHHKHRRSAHPRTLRIILLLLLVAVVLGLVIGLIIFLNNISAAN